MQLPPSDPHRCAPNETEFIHADNQVLSRFQTALRLQTVTKDFYDYDREQLQALVKHITESFPTVHSSPLVTWHTVANYSLLYMVQGTNQQLLPYLLMAHLDVVPVSNASVWEAPPFAGEIHNGFVYGRGAIDDKHSVFGILEALEFKLKQNWKPRRTLYIAFGHDEEASGLDGAAAISQLLQDQNVQFEFIADEGTMIVQGVVPGLDQPVALIGTSEKGCLTVKLSVTTLPGHSSMPGHESSIGILARAVSRLEDQLHDNMFGTGPELALFQHVAPYLNFPVRLIFANLWLFSPIISRLLSLDPTTNALIRTTTAVTIFRAGIKDNVIAPYAEAVVNHRIHPSQTVAEILKRDKEIIGDDRIKFEVRSAFEPHPVSDHSQHSFGFQTIGRTIQQVWGHRNVIIAPGLLVANTDTRHYLTLSRNIYRFAPTFLHKDDLKRFHGNNERIAVDEYERTVNYYRHLMTNADKESLESNTVTHQQHNIDL
jgi:carboxypeptidase PM20D1